MTAAIPPPVPPAKAIRAPSDKPTFEGTYACILAYNDETRIAKVVRLALGHCGNVVVCDDGSTDRTSDEAKQAGAQVLRHETRLGKGRTMSDLVNEVILRSPTGFVLLEREGYGHVDEIPAVLEPVMKGEADIAVATRETGGTVTVDAGVTAMNSKGLFTLYREGFFADVGTSPQTAIAAAAGLRVRAVILKRFNSELASPKDRGMSSTWPSRGWSHSIRVMVLERDFLAMGVPALAFIVAGLWLLAGFLLTYNFTGQIPVPQGVRGVIGLVSIVFGVAFMVSYIVIYSAKRVSRSKKE